MNIYNQLYINGEYAAMHGKQLIDLINPSTNEIIAKVNLADEIDTRNAIAAANKALKGWSQTTREERLNYLQKLYDAEIEIMDELVAATITEYGAPQGRAKGSNELSANIFLHVKEVLAAYEFEKIYGRSKVIFEPVGVVGIFTPWNSSAGSMHIKMAPALAAGCTVVIKPSEASVMQTQALIKAYFKAGLPPGVINIVCGLGEVVGKELSTNPDVQKIAFTGSTQIGKLVAKDALDTMKRFTLELGGKSPNIILKDADFEKAIPMAVKGCYLNNGQACIAASRLIVPKSRLAEVIILARKTAEAMKVGVPTDHEVVLGPLATVKQYERVQRHIQTGLNEGAKLVTGGLGHPEGLEQGNFVKPTIFAGVTNTMRIAQEEIFGPVLCIITYETEAEAIAIANDSDFGLMGYVSSANSDSALRVARQIKAGRMLTSRPCN